MQFELSKIDPYKCSIEELEKEIETISSIKDTQHDVEQSIKIFLNSIYGGIGSSYFPYYNAAAAEAITLQGQDLNKFTSKIIDEYFKNEWHLDKELHDKMGLTNVNKCVTHSFTIYMDTDSVYITFDDILQSCNFKGNPVDFILDIKKYRLDDYLNEKLDIYAKKFNSKNIQNYELEKISHSSIMVAKKKYILDLAWKDPGVNFKPQEKVKHVGIEVMQGSTPKFARKVIKELLNYTLDKKKQLQYSEVVKKLKDYKKEFLLQSPEDISLTKSIGSYETYILEDKKEFKIASKCPINVRSAGIYNFNLLNTKWKTKYNLLRTGDKVKYYYSKGQYDVFGFIPGNYPIEFAPQVDYDLQFEKVIIEPYNRILVALGMQEVPGSLIFAKSLF